ncbi:hypothetical protein N7471_008684 [Penicillium samsonianum]|uniref:uncharacterized protein n=1 Tax=Penicillium samsonianum TaxID=1882272 RepID=UPI00254788BE|nr:uncharacterized protein N7471_008684 [Penicillium samsonianum]KAJ6133469.1 hypothetical protein N7471_008684 [Penicillium samsonianum]
MQIRVRGALRAHALTQPFEEACQVMTMVQTTITMATNEFPHDTMLWAFEQRFQILLNEMLALRYREDYDRLLERRIWRRRR